MKRVTTVLTILAAMFLVSAQLYSQGDVPIQSVTFNNAGVATSGLSLRGTVTLSRALKQPAQIGLEMKGAPAGVSLSAPTVTVNTGQTTAQFEVRSQASAAGCAQIVAGTGASSRSGFTVFSPPSPTDVGFTFVTPHVVYWPVPGTGRASITLATVAPSRTAPTAAATTAAINDEVTLSSSNSSVIAVPKSVVVRPMVSNSVSLSISNFGCAVLTATRNGKSVRQAILSRFADGG